MVHNGAVPLGTVVEFCGICKLSCDFGHFHRVLDLKNSELSWASLSQTVFQVGGVSTVMIKAALPTCMPHCLLILGLSVGLFGSHLCGILYKQHHTSFVCLVQSGCCHLHALMVTPGPCLHFLAVVDVISHFAFLMRVCQLIAPHGQVRVAVHCHNQ